MVSIAASSSCRSRRSWRRCSACSLSADGNSVSIVSQPLLDRIGRALAAPLRPVGFECFEIGPYRPALRAAFRQRRFVLIGHGSLHSSLQPSATIVVLHFHQFHASFGEDCVQADQAAYSLSLPWSVWWIRCRLRSTIRDCFRCCCRRRRHRRSCDRIPTRPRRAPDAPRHRAREGSGGRPAPELAQLRCAACRASTTHRVRGRQSCAGEAKPRSRRSPRPTASPSCATASWSSRWTSASLPALAALTERAQANGVPELRTLDRDELREIEPHVAGVRALHSPTTGRRSTSGSCARRWPPSSTSGRTERDGSRRDATGASASRPRARRSRRARSWCARGCGRRSWPSAPAS